MKINVNNEERVNDALESVNQRVRNAYAYHVKNMVEQIERDLLAKKLSKKDWTWLRFSCNPNAQTFPNAYKGTPEATYFVIERFQSGWFLVDVKRDVCKGTPIRMVSQLTEDQKQAILNAFCKF
jgi:hypothetical protein